MKAATMAVVVAMLAGCVNLEGQLRTRAAFDLQCSESQLNVVEFDPWRRGVSGCGKKASYTYSQTSGWIMNTSDAFGVSPAKQ
ncbi:hypothetical protein [Pendulispora albinea]|uniref:Lipoprotein n=1 Tax=Pendulispora albinea TaxID=2741071 RepID=A0ABZ2LWI4_9BACT